MAELQIPAPGVVAASDLTAWREFKAGVIGLGTADIGLDYLGFRMNEHPWCILIGSGSNVDLKHAGWDLGSTDALDYYVATLRPKGIEPGHASTLNPPN